jgi:RES domain-containing protein
VIPPLPAALGGTEFVAWRLDPRQFASTWDSGEGAFRFGGRWNSPGVRAVYCSLDPATTILEVAVHRGFGRMDTVAHSLTSMRLHNPADVHVVDPSDLPNPGWLLTGMPSGGQQDYGDRLLLRHHFILVPSVVSRHSWNLIFVAARAAGRYELRGQDDFVLDTRLNLPNTIARV